MNLTKVVSEHNLEIINAMMSDLKEYQNNVVQFKEDYLESDEFKYKNFNLAYNELLICNKLSTTYSLELCLKDLKLDLEFSIENDGELIEDFYRETNENLYKCLKRNKFFTELKR